VRFVSHYGVYVSRMLSPMGRNAVFCCSRFNVTIADFVKLSVSHIYMTWRSSISPELINVTQVLLELVTVREGGLCFSEFDDVSIRQFIECICTS